MKLSIAMRITLLRRNLVACCTPHLQARGVSTGLLYYVLYVGRNPGCTASEAGRFLQMDAGYTTHAVAKLIQEGFLERRRDEKDRRAHRLYLTEKGQALFADSRTMLEAWGEQTMAGLTGREVEQLNTLLQKLAPAPQMDFPEPSW